MSLAGDGTAIVGICGGFQMLGRAILDPGHVESDRAQVTALGLLPVVTRFDGHKETHQVSGRVAADHGMLGGCRGLKFEGYEIHMGSSVADGTESQPFSLSRRSGGRVESGDGAISADGWTAGTYVHGLFHNKELRRGILARVAERKGACLALKDADFSQSAEYDKLADLFRASLDMEAVYRIAGLSMVGR